MSEEAPENSPAPSPESGKPTSPAPTEPALTPNQQTIDDLLWEIPFARPVWNFFVREGKAVRSGWIAVLVIIGITIYFTHSLTENGVNTAIYEATNYFGGELAKREQAISDLKGQFSDLKNDVREANRQRDVAQQRLDYFESNPDKLFEIYSNIFAHTPTNFEQVDSMFSQFNEAFSNNITAFSNASSHTSLGILINGMMITGVQPIILQTNRTIFVQATNTGAISAEHVTVDFAFSIDATNIINHGNWLAEPDMAGFSLFHIVFADPLASTKILSEPSLEISTNYYGQFFFGTIDVYADGTQLKHFNNLQFIVQ